ncbi:MAG TPA: BACON domain-containing protein, partial [Thermoanaerobaculia bacterium]|nr:BACON domain-containing protein [Thermoanaerobaculia bacterium]
AGGSSSRGNGLVSYKVDSNDGTRQRTGTMTIAGLTFTVTEDAGSGSCLYSIDATSKSFGSSGGTGSVAVTAPGSCAWTTTNTNKWITITSVSGARGNGTVNYSVDANTDAGPRTGTMTIAGQSFMVTQDAATSPPPQDSVKPAGAYLGMAGGCPGGTVSGTFSVSAASQVSWTAAPDQTAQQDGVTIDVSPSSGTGSGAFTVTITVPPQKPSSSYSNCSLTYKLQFFTNLGVTFSDSGGSLFVTAYYDFIGVT